MSFEQDHARALATGGEFSAAMARFRQSMEVTYLAIATTFTKAVDDAMSVDAEVVAVDGVRRLKGGE